MIRLALDIETDAMPERVAELPEPEVAVGNMKDPEKIKEKVAAAKRAQIARMALDPHFARVLAVGLRTNAMPEPIARVRLPAGGDDAERDLLVDVWNQVSTDEQLWTFNGAAFDIPFLMRRSLLLGVRPALVEIDKYKVRNFAGQHVDLYQLLQHWEVGNGHGTPLNYAHNQTFYAKAILGRVPPYGDLDKGTLGELLAAGQSAIIHQLVGWDVETTFLLGERLRAVYP